jgi:hypothetical protein
MKGIPNRNCSPSSRRIRLGKKSQLSVWIIAEILLELEEDPEETMKSVETGKSQTQRFKNCPVNKKRTVTELFERSLPSTLDQDYCLQVVLVS